MFLTSLDKEAQKEWVKNIEKEKNTSLIVAYQYGGQITSISPFLSQYNQKKKKAEKLNVPLLGEIPLSPNIREYSDKGTPIVIAEPEGAHANSYKTIANQILQTIQKNEFLNSQQAPKIEIE